MSDRERTTPPSAPPAPGPQRDSLPQELILLPLLNVVIYPLTVTPLAIGQELSVRLVDEAIADGRMLGMVALRGARRPELLGPEDLFTVGTAAVVHRMVRLHDNTLRVAVEGVQRFQIARVLGTEPDPRAAVAPLPDAQADRAARAEARAFAQAATALAGRLPPQGASMLEELVAETDPQRLSFLAASKLLVRSSLAERQRALELTGVAERLAELRRILERDLAALGPA